MPTAPGHPLPRTPDHQQSIEYPEQRRDYHDGIFTHSDPF